MKIVSTAIVGSGNLACQLALALKKAGTPPLFIHSRDEMKGRRLARQSGSKWLAEIPDAEGTCLLLICVSDDAIRSTAKKFRKKGYIPVHSSGMINLDEIKFDQQPCGVLYPLQTISATGHINWKETPLFLEASDRSTYLKIRALALRLSSTAIPCDSQQRSYLHLAAVFANNFSNACMAMAESLLRAHRLPFSHLQPLMKQTLLNAFQSSPSMAQTGPARRGDRRTISRHLKLLKDKPELRSIYRTLSGYIGGKY